MIVPHLTPHFPPFSVTRDRITDEHWSLVKDAKEALGHDRETYEHSLRLSQVFQAKTALVPKTGGEEGEMAFMLRLGGLLDSTVTVKEVAELEEAPVVMRGKRDRDRGRGQLLRFCEVDTEAMKRIEAWFLQRGILSK